MVDNGHITKIYITMEILKDASDTDKQLDKLHVLMHSDYYYFLLTFLYSKKTSECEGLMDGNVYSGVQIKLFMRQ